MDESKKESNDPIGFMEVFLSLLVALIPIGVVVGAVSVIYAAYSERLSDYEQFGCYPITRDYQECGPIEGKPGFTKCVTKTERVCPKTGE